MKVKRKSVNIKKKKKVIRKKAVEKKIPVKETVTEKNFSKQKIPSDLNKRVMEMSQSVYCPEKMKSQSQVPLAWCIYRCPHRDYCNHYQDIQTYNPERLELARQTTKETERKVDASEVTRIENKTTRKERPRKKKGAIEARARQLIREYSDKGNKEIAEMIRAEFKSRTSAVCVSWYRNQIKKENKNA